MDDHGRQTRESFDFVMLLLATAGFLAAHFHIGDADVVFWVSVTFNLMVAFGVATRK
jgi:hypothetical protein